MMTPSPNVKCAGIHLFFACMALAALLCFFCTLPTIAAEDSVSVDELHAIHIRDDGARIKDAAKLLSEGLQKIYGRPWPIVQSQEAIPAQGVIVLGPGAAMACGVMTSDQLETVWPGGHMVQIGQGRVVLAGADAIDTNYAVVALLEKLGVRFFTANGLKDATIPSQAPSAWATEKYSYKPAFIFRPGHATVLYQTTSELGDPHRGANPELFDPAKTGSNLWRDHTAGYLVPKLLYYDQHPEYYAQLPNGQRIAKTAFTDLSVPLCLSNPSVKKISLDRALAWTARDMDSRMFPITNGDTTGWCQCAACLALDPRPGEFTTRLLQWVNPIAKAIGQQRSHVIVTTLAYAGSNIAPPTLMPAENLWVVGATGWGNIPFWDHAQITRDPTIYAKDLPHHQGWLRLLPNRYAVCEYLAEMYYPSPVDCIAGRLRSYEKFGIRGIVYRYGTTANFAALTDDVFSRLLWNPNQNTDTLTHEALQFHYGQAAPALEKYFQLCHERYTATLHSDVPLVNQYPPDFYSPAFVKASITLLSEAQQAVRNDARLGPVLANETAMMLADVLAHLPDQQADELVTTVFDGLSESAKITGDWSGVIHGSQALYRATIDKPQGQHVRDLCVQWMTLQPQMQPRWDNKTNTLRLDADQFFWGDRGPVNLPMKEGWWKIDSPPNRCVILLPAIAGRSNIHQAQACLKLQAIPSAGTPKLVIQGMDAMLAGQAAQEKRLTLFADMQVQLNGQLIFKGHAALPRGQWGELTIPLPAGLLKVGDNTLLVTNTSGPGYWPTTNWLCLSGIWLQWDAGEPSTSGQ